MNGSPASLRERVGCWLHERWRLEAALRAPALASRLGLGWMDLCNRHESLKRDDVSGGRVCLWEDSSALTVARVFPRAAHRLLSHCLEFWPIRFADARPTEAAADPDLSIVIGVRGTGRLPQLRACLAAARGQSNATIEIVLVEQSWGPEFQEFDLPDVRYLHQQSTSPDMPYNRSWALNAGARHARGRHLLLHDADMLLPQRAAEVVVKILDGGMDAVRVPRLLFYLDKSSSEALQRSERLPEHVGMERVIANNRTPIAVRRDAYFAIGGHDESYYGWGAEDDDFMDRLRTMKVAEGAVLPIVHLWHGTAAAEPSRARNAGILAEARRRPVEGRIEALRREEPGQPTPRVVWKAHAEVPG